MKKLHISKMAALALSVVLLSSNVAWGQQTLYNIDLERPRESMGLEIDMTLSDKEELLNLNSEKAAVNTQTAATSTSRANESFAQGYIGEGDSAALLPPDGSMILQVKGLTEDNSIVDAKGNTYHFPTGLYNPEKAIPLTSGVGTNGSYYQTTDAWVSSTQTIIPKTTEKTSSLQVQGIANSTGLQANTMPSAADSMLSIINAELNTITAIVGGTFTTGANDDGGALAAGTYSLGTIDVKHGTITGASMSATEGPGSFLGVNATDGSGTMKNGKFTINSTAGTITGLGFDKDIDITIWNMTGTNQTGTFTITPEEIQGGDLNNNITGTLIPNLPPTK